MTPEEIKKAKKVATTVTKEQVNNTTYCDIHIWHRDGGWVSLDRPYIDSWKPWDYVQSMALFMIDLDINDMHLHLYSKGCFEYGLEYLD